MLATSLRVLVLMLLASVACAQDYNAAPGRPRASSSSYTWSLGDLAAYEARIPLLAAHDWSNDLDTQAEVEAAWTGETVEYVDAVDCDAAGVGSNEDRTALQAAMGNNKVVVLRNQDGGGAQSPCYYDFTTPMGGTYHHLALIGQSATTTILNFDVQPANRTTTVASALVFGSETGLSGSAIAYSGSLARGATTLTAASGTWAVNDPVTIRSTDADGESIEFSTFLTAVASLDLTLNDPVPFAYSTGTITKLTKTSDLVILNLGFDTPLAHRGTCAEQASLGDCRYIDIPQRSRTVIANVDFIRVPRTAVNARYSNNNVIKHFVMSENLSLSRNGTRNSTVPNANGLGDAGSDRIYDGYFRQGAGRLFGKGSVSGNNWYGFLAFDEDQSQIGDPVTGYTNAGATVHDTGNFYTGGLVTDDAVFPVYQGNNERLWFYHDCADGFSDNTAPNVWESSEVEGPVLADLNCGTADNGRYHTFFRLFGVDAASDIDFSSTGLLAYANWIMVKANSRSTSTNAKANSLNLYNLYASRDSNAGTGADYVSTGEETGSSTLSTCGSRDMPPSLVLRQNEPPCWWCSEYGTAGDNYGWNGGWDYGACDSSSSPDLPAKRRFQSVACTAPPTCVDY